MGNIDNAFSLVSKLRLVLNLRHFIPAYPLITTSSRLHIVQCIGFTFLPPYQHSTSVTDRLESLGSHSDLNRDHKLLRSIRLDMFDEPNSPTAYFWIMPSLLVLLPHQNGRSLPALRSLAWLGVSSRLVGTSPPYQWYATHCEKKHGGRHDIVTSEFLNLTYDSASTLKISEGAQAI